MGGQRSFGPQEFAMRFSIVMTVYDTWHFLSRALAGVMQQQECDWELLVVSDGPAPHGAFAPVRMLKQLERRMPGRRLEFWELPRAAGCWGNRGRNFALQHARGEYVCWVNHDNLLSPNYLAAHALNIAKCPGCVSVVNIDYWKNDVYHGRYPRALARSRIDLLNFAVPLETACEVKAFGPAMETVYAADWLTFDACRRLRPVEWNRQRVGTHF